MKKLVIASAVAAVMASGSVMADTTLGGHMRLKLQNMDSLALNSGKLVVTLNGSEDMGNGMTGIAYLEMENDSADNEENQFHNDKSYVGIKGDFGQLTLGAQGDAAGFACGGTDIFIDNSGAACGTGAVNGTLDNAIVYVKGFGAVTLVLGATFDGGDGGAGLDSDGTQTSPRVVSNPAGGDHSVVAVNFDGGAFTIGAQITTPDSDVLNDARTAIGGTVKLGEATLGLTFTSNGEDANDTATAIAVALPLGGGTLKAGVDMAGDDSISGFTGGGSNVESVTNLEFDKNLSKSVYAGVQYSAISAASGTDPDDLIQGYIGYKF